ncbi:MAG: histidine phosphatase family protein [Spirochaetes bacterium]|mgnify:CR=1 FL=1|nr:MAG: histidine phosphatase family protein [Spirochaetota bacterium]
MTRILLVRHGQTRWNVQERFRGRADIPLDDVGIAQAEKTAAWIACYWKPKAVYSSPLSRALKTAELIAGACNLDVHPHEDMIDINYGDWQGLSPEEVKERWPDLSGYWYSEPHRIRIPKAETIQELKVRGVKAVKDICLAHEDATVVIVGHTVINRVIILGILDIDLRHFWHIRQDTCAINEIQEDNGRFFLASLNDTCHLREPDTIQHHH